MPQTPTWNAVAEEERLEAWLQLLAIPVALLVARLMVAMPFVGMLAHNCIAMWLHELGHAVTSWLCGYGAFPGPFFTPRSENRLPLVSLLVAGALGYGGYRAWLRQLWGLVGLAVVCLVLQLFGTLVVSAFRAEMLILFFGDGGALMLGALCMTTVYSAKDGPFVQGWLRWGLLAIGALTWTVVATHWWAAKLDFGEIPFGEIEGVALSDPTRLVDDFGWSELDLVHRYVRLAEASLAVVGVVYLQAAARAVQILTRAR